MSTKNSKNTTDALLDALREVIEAAPEAKRAALFATYEALELTEVKPLVPFVDRLLGVIEEGLTDLMMAREANVERIEAATANLATFEARYFGEGEPLSESEMDEYRNLVNARDLRAHAKKIAETNPAKAATLEVRANRLLGLAD